MLRSAARDPWRALRSSPAPVRSFLPRYQSPLPSPSSFSSSAPDAAPPPSRFQRFENAPPPSDAGTAGGSSRFRQSADSQHRQRHEPAHSNAAAERSAFAAGGNPRHMMNVWRERCASAAVDEAETMATAVAFLARAVATSAAQRTDAKAERDGRKPPAAAVFAGRALALHCERAVQHYFDARTK